MKKLVLTMLMVMCLPWVGERLAAAQPAPTGAPPAMSAATLPPAMVSPAPPSAPMPAGTVPGESRSDVSPPVESMEPAMEVTPAPAPAVPAAAPAAGPAPVLAKKMSGSQIASLVFQIVIGLVSLVFTILFGLNKMAWTKDARWKKVQSYLELGFDAVEGLVKGTQNKVDDKLLEFLKRVNAMLREQGEAELSETEKKAAVEYAANKALAEKKP